jgi:hypothetical protein
VEENIVKQIPTVEEHLESFGEWTFENLKKAFLCLVSKL